MKIHKQKARFDRYKNGLLVPCEKTKSGTRRDFSQPANDNDSLLVKKGEVYYWIKFKNAPKQFFSTPPTDKDLCKSDYMLALLEMQEMVSSDVYDHEGFNEMVQSIQERAEELLSDIEEKKGNMEAYGGLMNTPNYELLCEREDEIQNILDELSCVNEMDEASTEDEMDEALESLRNCF
jgi:hypothetical protein